MDQTKHEPFDVNDYLGRDVSVRITYKGHVMRHYFREMDAETDLAWRKRGGRTVQKGSEKVMSDEALQADLWLYDRLCKKVEIEVGEQIVEVEDFKYKVSPRIKRLALTLFWLSIGNAEESEGN